MGEFRISSPREALCKLGLFLRACPILLQNDHHLAKACILLVNSRLAAHLNNLADLVLALSRVLIQTTAILLIVLVGHSCVLVCNPVVFRFEHSSRARASRPLIIPFETLTELLIVCSAARASIWSLLVTSGEAGALFSFFANTTLLALFLGCITLLLSILAFGIVHGDLKIGIDFDLSTPSWTLLLLLTSCVEARSSGNFLVSLGRHRALRLGLRRSVVEVVDDIGDISDLLLTAARSVGGALSILTFCMITGLFTPLWLLGLQRIISGVDEKLRRWSGCRKCLLLILVALLITTLLIIHRSLPMMRSIRLFGRLLCLLHMVIVLPSLSIRVISAITATTTVVIAQTVPRRLLYEPRVDQGLLLDLLL